MTPGDEVVRVERCSKAYRRGPEIVRALNDVSIVLSAGEVVAVAGPSGSGKTTLLNVVIGWEQPDRGRVVWSVAGGARPPSWAQLGVVPQRLGLVDELTALENIGLPLRWQAGTAPANQVDELCRVLGLEDVADRLPAQMSLGQQQRVAIARALVLQPAMIALDEPTAHQDESSADAVAAALRAAALAGTCCLIATHAPDLLARVDRTITLTDGRVASATD